MGKRLGDLHLNDSPIEVQLELFEAHAAQADAATSEDVRDTEWYQFVGTIDDLLTSDGYTWAFDTLTGIKETVEHSHRVTEGQRRAIRNIEERGETARSTRRRYEGFRNRPW